MPRLRRIVALALLLFVAAPAGSLAARWTATDPPIDIAHIERGRINHWGEAVGWHHRADGRDPAGARVLRILNPPDAAGVYRALVALRDPRTGAWVEKHEPSSFFPDNMSERAVVAAVLEAFRRGRPREDGRFIGPSGRGFPVEGWYEGGRIRAAYPLYRPP